MPAPFIQVRITDATLQQVDALRENVHALSRSDAIRVAVDLSDMLTKAAKRGERIIIEGKNGRRQINIEGIDPYQNYLDKLLGS